MQNKERHMKNDVHNLFSFVVVVAAFHFKVSVAVYVIRNVNPFLFALSFLIPVCLFWWMGGSGGCYREKRGCLV